MKFIFFVIFLIFFPLSENCCLKFDTDGCLQCPTNMHLFRENCIYNLPYCLQHEGFVCKMCQKGYKVDQSVGKCQRLDFFEAEIPKFGYKMEQTNKKIIQKLEEQSQKRSELAIQSLLKIYSFSTKTYIIFKIIFVLDQGFLENTFLTPLNYSSFILRESIKILPFPDEVFVHNFTKDPNFKFIEEIIKDELNEQIVGGFRKQQNYRIFLDSTQKGSLKELKVSLLQTTLTLQYYVDIQLLNSTQQKALETVKQIVGLEEAQQPNSLKKIITFSKSVKYQVVYKNHSITLVFIIHGENIVELLSFSSGNSQNPNFFEKQVLSSSLKESTLTPEEITKNKTISKMVDFIEAVEGCESCQVKDIKIKDKGEKERFDIKIFNHGKPFYSVVEITKQSSHLSIALIEPFMRTPLIKQEKLLESLSLFGVSQQKIVQKYYQNDSLILVSYDGLRYDFKENQLFPLITSNLKSINEIPQKKLISKAIQDYFKIKAQIIMLKKAYQQVNEISYFEFYATKGNIKYLIKFVYYNKDKVFFPISMNEQKKSFLNIVKQELQISEFYTQVRSLFGPKITIKKAYIINKAQIAFLIKLYLNGGSQNVELIYNHLKKQILRIRYLEESFVVKRKTYENTQKQGKWLEKIFRYQKIIILKEKIRKGYQLIESQFYLQVQNKTFFIKFLKKKNISQIIEFRSLPSNIKAKKQQIQKQISQHLDNVKEQFEFKNVERLLSFSPYDSYLTHSSLVYVQDQILENHITYKAIYKSSKGYFQAIMQFNYQTQKTVVKSFHYILPHLIPNFILNCKTQQQKQCIECKKGYYLVSNNYCFWKSEGCKIQSGDVCIECEYPFNLNKKNYKCE